MIKFSGTASDGSELIGIGLSRGNFQKLLEGKPIVFKTSDIGMKSNIEVFIMGGETEQDMAQELARIGVLKGVPIRTFDEDKEQAH